MLKDFAGFDRVVLDKAGLFYEVLHPFNVVFLHGLHTFGLLFLVDLLNGLLCDLVGIRRSCSREGQKLQPGFRLMLETTI